MKKVLSVIFIAMMLVLAGCGGKPGDKWFVTGIVAGDMKTTQADLEDMGLDDTEYLFLGDDGTFEWRCFESEGEGSWTKGDDGSVELEFTGQEDNVTVSINGSKAVFTDNEGIIYTLKKQGE